MKALNTSFLWQQMEEVDTICQNFFNESYSKGSFIQHHILHVAPRINISGNFYAAELQPSAVLRLWNSLIWLLLLYHPFKSKLNWSIILEVQKSRMVHVSFAEVKNKSA